jgi:putative FmdB family regulatory protein
MPLYEYQCEKCGHRFEKIQKFSDKLVKKCPECGGRVEQVISAPAVQFKGSGWYVTDYAKKSGASAGDGKESKKEDKSKGESSAKDSSLKEGSKESPKESSGKESSSKESSSAENSSRKPGKRR